MSGPDERTAGPHTGAFVHTFLPGRVVYGAGAVGRVAAEVERLGVRRALVVASTSARDAADLIQEQLGERFAGRIDGVAQHVPSAAADEARTMARELGADAIVAIGGGSAVGLAKAIALTSANRSPGLTTTNPSTGPTNSDRAAGPTGTDRAADLTTTGPSAGLTTTNAPAEPVGVDRAGVSSGAGLGHATGGGEVVIVAVPTTYAGSEMTPVWGETAGGSKRTGTDPRVLPRVVVYDPVLSQHLPLKVTAASVANAIAHCVEAVWTPKADPFTETIAVEGLRALSSGLRAVLVAPEDLEARGKLLYGACLAGSALATGGTGLHHKLCHLLGGTYNLPHAETHAAVLPQVARVNAPAVPHGAARLTAALGTADADLAGGLFDLFQKAGTATSLRELGLTKTQVDEAAAAFTATENPVPVSEELVREILVRAWDGARP